MTFQPGAGEADQRPSAAGAVLNLRSALVLRAIVDGEEIETAITPHRVVTHDGGHKKAMEMEAEVFGSVLPFPLEETDSVFVSLFQDTPDDPYASVIRSESIRFVGYIDEEEVDDQARAVRIKARDLSAPLREHHPLIPKRFDDGRRIDPTPHYSDTLRQAIERILSVVPGFEPGGSRQVLTLREVPALDLQLGQLVEGRAKSGPVSLPAKCSAWDAIEVVCGLAARLVSVELGEIVVREPRDVFRTDGRPDYTFVFGADNANSFGPKRSKKFIRNRKGVKLIAWNPETRTRVESVYPSDGEMRKNFPRRRPAPKAHKPTRKAASHPARALPPPDRDVYAIGSGTWSQAELDAMAERVWLQKGLGEVEGTVSSPIWDKGVLGLKNGMRIAVKVRPDLEAQVRALNTDEERAQFLAATLGLETEAARALVRVVMNPRDDLYSVRTVTREWPNEKAVTVGFANLFRA